MVAVASSPSLSDAANCSVSDDGLETVVPGGSVALECNEVL